MNGNKVALYDGADWTYHALSELTLSLSGLAADTNYDVFIYDSSSLTLEAVAWTNATTRATALALQDGVYVKTGATGRRYLGTFRTTASTGQCEDSISKRYLWNYYNRAPRVMRVVDTTNSWTYDTATWRAARGQAANKVEYVCGVSDALISAFVLGYCDPSTATAIGAVGVGVDSSSATSAQIRVEDVTVAATPVRVSVQAHYEGYPGLGYHYLQWIEYVRNGTVAFNGDGDVATMQTGLKACVNG